MKEQAVSTASKVANKATSLLGKGLSALSSPIGIASIAVLGLITNLSQMAEQAEQNNINNLFEDYQEAVEKSNIDLTKFDDLYKQYKKTGDVSDELIKVSEELSESLDIVGGKALINAGNFDELSEAIHKASDESRELAKRNIDRTLAAIDNAESQHTPFSQDFAAHFQNLPGMNEINQRTGITYDLLGNDTSGMNSLEKYQAINKELLNAEQNIQKYEEQLEKAKVNEDNYLAQTIENKIAHEEDIRNQLAAVLEHSDMQKIAEIVEAESKIAEEEILNNKEELKRSTEEDLIANFTDLEGPYKFLAVKIANLGEEAGKEYVHRLIESIKGSQSDLETINILGNVRNTEERTAIKDDLKLSDQEYTVYQNTLIDTNLNLQELKQSTEEYDKNKEAIEKTSDVLIERNDELEKEKQQLIEESKSLQGNSRQLAENEKRITAIDKTLTKNNKTLDENAKILKDNAEQNEYEKESLEDLENKIIETAKGAEELSKV